MLDIKRLGIFLTVLALAGPTTLPLAGKNKKGDKLVADGRAKEARKDFDAALELYEQALSQDPADPYYQLCADRARFQAGQAHVSAGLKIRGTGNLTQALIEFQKAYQIDAASSMAEMEIRRTQEMIDREKKKVPKPGVSPEDQAKEAALTPGALAKKQAADKLALIQPIPELMPVKKDLLNLVLRSQPPRVLFETVGKMAGINVLFDPDFVQQSTKPMSIDITNSTLEQALDYLSVLTRAFWKPLSSNTIFVTQDNTTKRRDFEEQVMKIFYLNNVNSPQELQEIVTTIRSVADLQRLFVYNAQNAIIARGEADRIALAEKIITALDKPKSEVVVDIVVLQAARNRTRDIAAAVAQTGLNIPINYTPGGVAATTTPGTSTSGVTTTPTTTSSSIPLSRVNRISTKDFSVTLPGGLLEALMSDSTTRILQSPQVRAVDNMKAILKIGQKVPTASGSFQPGIGGVGINPLVNTQFTYIDVGVNVDLTPHIHENGELDLHIEVEISSVDNHVNLGGIDQPVIGQRKVTHDIRLKEGQVNLLGGLMQLQETKTKTGIPGLASIPLVGRLFSAETLERDSSELVIALVPHIIRRPEITAEDLKGIAVGNQTVVKLNYGPRPDQQQQTPGQTPQAEAQPATPPTQPTGTAVVAPTPTPAPATTPPLATNPAQAPVAPPVPAPPAATTPTAPAQPSDATKATVAFAPVQSQTQMGGTVRIDFAVSNATDLFSMPLTFNYDPKIVSLVDVIRGPVMGSDGNQPAFSKNVQNESGTASVSLSRMYGRPGVPGNGVLLTLVFQAVGTGTTTVSLPQVGLRDSKGALVPMVSDQPPKAVIIVK